jgi:eukaryotic-like serine/threonine-protein kinase
MPESAKAPHTGSLSSVTPTICRQPPTPIASSVVAARARARPRRSLLEPIGYGFHLDATDPVIVLCSSTPRMIRSRARMTTARERREGAVVARYRLDRRLGEGGFGEVWAATHVVTRRGVALKFLKERVSSDDRARQRFLREARAASAVVHPNVIVIHDVFEDDGVPIMVMDLLEGESLGARLRRDRTLSLPDVATIMLPVISAVHAAHAVGVLHRDLKPDNIFLARSALAPGSGLEVRVLDFGIAKLTSPEDAPGRSGALTHSDTVLGTPFYMSPEQFFGEREIDSRSDVWAIGVIVYECLAGVRPTEAKTVAHVVKVIVDESIVALSRHRPDLPEEVTEVVMRALSIDRAKRPSILEMGRVLTPYAGVVSDVVATMISGRPGPLTPRADPAGHLVGALELHPDAQQHPPGASPNPIGARVHAGYAQTESIPATPSPLTMPKRRPTMHPRALGTLGLVGGGAALFGVAVLVWRPIPGAPGPVSSSLRSSVAPVAPRSLRSSEATESPQRSVPVPSNLAPDASSALSTTADPSAADAGQVSSPGFGTSEGEPRGSPAPSTPARAKPRAPPPFDPGSFR